MKKTVLDKYIPIEAFLMEEEKANEFDQLFETLLILLKLNQNLTPEIKNEDDWSLTIYARDKIGMSQFSLSLSATLKDFDDGCYASEFHLMILSYPVDLTSIDILNVDYELEKYSCNLPYDEDTMLHIFREIVRCV